MNKSYFMRTSAVLLALALLPFSAIKSVAQEMAPVELSLDQAIQYAIENTFSIKIADENLQIARNNNIPGIAGASPTVDINFNVNNGYTNLNQPASFLLVLQQINTSLSPGASLNWLIYDGGRVKITKERLDELVRGGEVDLRIAMENAIEIAILTYYQALLRKEQITVLGDVLELSRDRIEYEEVKREFGQASTFDILQTRDAYLNDSLTYIAEQTNYANAIHDLNLAMGQENMAQDYILVDSLIGQLPDYELATLRQAMAANNNRLANLQVDRELAYLDTRLAESERLPQVNLGLGGSYNFSNTLWGTGTFASGEDRDLGGVQNKTINGFLNLSASYRLFDGGVRRVNIENAKVRELNAQYNIEQARLELDNQLLNTYTRFLNQKEQVEVTTDLMDNASQNLSIADERFRGGLINSFDYRVIQLNYINASQSRLTAIFNLKLTETELRRLVGALVQ